MLLDRQTLLQLGLLLMAVPAQYFITTLMSTTEAQRTYNLKTNKYLTWKSWHRWCLDLLSNYGGLHPTTPSSEDMNGESPAVEVMKYKDSNGYFANSPDVRSPRPSHVKYRIGQVIRHKLWGYRGVIIGWDLEAKAPESWFAINHPKNKKHWRVMPNYSILVDTRDRLQPQTVYVPEENLEIIDDIHVKLIHPAIMDYFEHFDGVQYLPRPWMRTLYPHG